MLDMIQDTAPLFVPGVNVGSILKQQRRELGILYVHQWGLAPIIIQIRINTVQIR